MQNDDSSLILQTPQENMPLQSSWLWLSRPLDVDLRVSVCELRRNFRFMGYNEWWSPVLRRNFHRASSLLHGLGYQRLI